MAMKHLLVSHHSEYEMHQTDVYVFGMYGRFCLKRISSSLTSFIGIPNSVSILHTYLII